ncbi:MAG: YigZ family protein [Bacillales bacterium]|nr:YigZ family protein [Bacillales bacterium]
MKKTIKDTVLNEIVINKSRFITFVFPINSLDEIKNIISSMRKQYYDATHIVYAYILKETEKSSDDKEPKGTAGRVMMDILHKMELDNVLSLTVRYFGGIKLGKGGLVRAYSSTLSDALLKAQFIFLKKTVLFSFSLSYQDASRFDKIMDNPISIEKEYQDNVVYTLRVLQDDYLKYKNLLLSFSSSYRQIGYKEEEIYL